MERLAQRDIDTLLAWLRALYAQRRAERFTAFIIDSIPTLIASELTACFHIEGRPDTIRLVADPPMNVVTRNGEQVFVAHFLEHPLTHPPHELTDTRVLRLSDAVTSSEWHRLGMYNEFFRPARIEHEIGFLFTPHPHATCDGLTLNRGGMDFSERERTLLEAARPHIAQAFANATSYTRVATLLATASEAIQASGVDLVALDSDRLVQFSTEGALARLWRYFGPRLRVHEPPGDLPEPVRRWVTHQIGLLQSHDDAPPPVTSLSVERDDRRLEIRLLPADTDGQSLLVLEEQIRRPLAESLEQLGLTPRQCEIVALVADGLTNQEIAWELSISPLTVRTHLEHIFARLEVASRAELVGRAFEHAMWQPIAGRAIA